MLPSRCYPLIPPPRCCDCVQLTVPCPLGSAPISSSRATWLQVDISGASWPVLRQATYYWIVVAPGSPLVLDPSAGGNGVYDGAVWSGVSDDAGILPAATLADRNLFTGRQLVSQRSSGDSLFAAGSVSATSFLLGSSLWPSVPNAGARYVNWQALGSHVRYGLQVVGVQLTPSPTPSTSLSRSATPSVSGAQEGLLRHSLRLSHHTRTLPPFFCSVRFARLRPFGIILCVCVDERERELLHEL